MIFDKTFIELFAGVGLVGKALSQRGWKCVMANDICPIKKKMYVLNGGDPSVFILDDIRNLTAEAYPPSSLLTASFPCVDFSTAGKRKGFGGTLSRCVLSVIDMLGALPDEQKPTVLLFENVMGSIFQGKTGNASDLIRGLARIGYSVIDLRVIDASHFTAQSRKRVFMIATTQSNAVKCDTLVQLLGNESPEETKPLVAQAFMKNLPCVAWVSAPSPGLPDRKRHLLKDFVDLSLPWTNCPRSPTLRTTFDVTQVAYAQANTDRFRVFSFIVQTRKGRPTSELNREGKAYCLRTGRGRLMSNLMKLDINGEIQVRYLEPAEYAALQGAPDFQFGDLPKQHCFKAMGDAVCVPVILWIIDNVLLHFYKSDT